MTGSRRNSTLLLGCVTALVVFAPLLLGGVTGLTSAVILGATAATVLVAAWTFRRTSEETLRGTPFLVVALSLCALATLIQLIPVPHALLRVLQPHRAYVETQLDKLGVDPLWPSLTSTTGGTLHALTLAVSITALAATASALARIGRAKALALAVGTSTVLHAVTALMHTALDAHTVFGLYTPRFARPGLLMGPLLNGNHTAGHMALGLPVCLAWATKAKRIEARIAGAGAAALVVVCSLLSLSRGGLAATLFAGAAYLIWFWNQSKHTFEQSSTWYLQTAVAGAGAALLATLYADALKTSFGIEGISTEKLHESRRVLEIASSYPWFGVGKGGLADFTVPLFPGTRWVEFAESLPIQWLADWGYPFTLVAFLAAGVGIRFLHVRRSSDAALACGVAALALQNLVDFSLEKPGVAVVAAVALGTVAGTERGVSRHTPRLRSWLLGAAGLAVCAFTTQLLLLGPRGRDDVHDALREQLVPAGVVADDLRNHALALYPCDPALLLFAATSAVNQGAAHAVDWLALSMATAQEWAGPHLLAATYLEQHSRADQAAIELSLGAEIDPIAWSAQICSFVARQKSARLTMQALPAGKHRDEALVRVAECLHPLPDQAIAFADLWLEQEPVDTLVPLTMKATALLSLARLDEAAAIADSLVASYPSSPIAWSRLISTYTRQGRADDTRLAIARIPPSVARDLQLLQQIVASAGLLHDERLLSDTVTELIQRFGRSPTSRAQLELFASTHWAIAGNPAKALSHALRARHWNRAHEVDAIVYQRALEAGERSRAQKLAEGLCQARFQPERYCRASNEL